MTWLWTSLIVLGIAMIAVAVWPSISSRRKSEPAESDDDRATPGDGPKPEGV
jgi:hypothetical protein